MHSLRVSIQLNRPDFGKLGALIPLGTWPGFPVWPRWFVRLLSSPLIPVELFPFLPLELWLLEPFNPFMPLEPARLLPLEPCSPSTTSCCNWNVPEIRNISKAIIIVKWDIGFLNLVKLIVASVDQYIRWNVILFWAKSMWIHSGMGLSSTLIHLNHLNANAIVGNL